MSRYVDYNGVVKLAVKQNKKSYYEAVKYDKRLVDFCLNCRKPKCNGECPEFKAYRRLVKK